MKADPLPEQPNQYNRVCDAVSPVNKEGCAAQKTDPLPEQPNQYNRVCDAVSPVNKEGCAAQVKRVCDSANPQPGCADSLEHRGNNMVGAKD
jgi:hypothetical protein